MCVQCSAETPGQAETGEPSLTRAPAGIKYNADLDVDGDNIYIYHRHYYICLIQQERDLGEPVRHSCEEGRNFNKVDK